jgi:hypothetical protein
MIAEWPDVSMDIWICGWMGEGSEDRMEDIMKEVEFYGT